MVPQSTLEQIALETMSKRQYARFISKTAWKSSLLCNVGRIHGMTTDNDGNLYFTTDSDSVFKISAQRNSNSDSETFRTHYIVCTRRGAWFRGIVFNPFDNCLYICDAFHHTIDKYSIINKSLSVYAGSGKMGCSDGNIKHAKFDSPWGITTDLKGNLYLTDMHHIRKINIRADTVETIAGATTGVGKGGNNDGPAFQAEFRVPGSLAISKDGTIYVSDRQNAKIRQIKDGLVSTLAHHERWHNPEDGPLSSASVDSQGDLLLFRGSLLVCDSSSGLRRIDLKNQFVSTLDVPRISRSSCMCIDKVGNLFIAGEHDVYKVVTQWGSERYLWIAHLKEHPSYCPLATLPKDIIREIASYIYWEPYREEMR